jgi:DNA-binding CsgD family transcriptional regulator
MGDIIRGVVHHVGVHMRDESDELINLIYEAGFMPSLWPRTLDRLAHHVGARGGLLMIKSGSAEKWTASSSLDSVMREFVDEGWVDQNVRAVRCRAASRHPGFLTDHDLMSSNELETLPLYTEFLRPRGFDEGVGTTIQGIQADGLMITFEGFPSYLAARNSVLALNRLRPHLARASAISAQMHLNQAQAATDALAAIGTAAAIITEDACVVSANALFNQNKDDAIDMRSGRMRLLNSDANIKFSSALENRDSFLGTSIAVRRDSQSPLIIHLLPTSLSAQSIFFPRSILLVIDRLNNTSPLKLDFLQSLYDLTPAEANVAFLVAEGNGLGMVASKLGISSETVRTHLKRAFAKTGTGKQAALSLRLQCMTPPNL